MKKKPHKRRSRNSHLFAPFYEKENDRYPLYSFYRVGETILEITGPYYEGGKTRKDGKVEIFAEGPIEVEPQDFFSQVAFPLTRFDLR